MKKNTFTKILFLFVFLLQSHLFAQTLNNSPKSSNSFQNQFPTKTISFGQKVHFDFVETSSTWTIKNVSNNLVVKLFGNQINDFVFENSGTFEILYSDNATHKKEECDHSHFPAKTILEVSPVNMKFDFSKITFSEKIRKETNYENVIVSVPVNVKTFDKKSAKVEMPNSSVTGVGVNLKLTPVINTIELQNGIQILTYKLSGIINNETYLMYDFKDCNNQVQTYNQLERIN